jgi:hypothetical protein
MRLWAVQIQPDFVRLLLANALQVTVDVDLVTDHSSVDLACRQSLAADSSCAFSFCRFGSAGRKRNSRLA